MAAKTKRATKRNAKPEPKNLGGRPKKDPDELARRITFYCPGKYFKALLSRAQAIGTEPLRAPNESHPRGQSETEDVIVSAYTREQMIRLAERIAKAES